MRFNGKIIGIGCFDLLHHITRILNPYRNSDVYLSKFFSSEAGTWTRVTPKRGPWQMAQRTAEAYRPFSSPQFIPNSAELANGLGENMVESDTMGWIDE